MADDIPPWLNVMRSLTGTKEVAGAGANPVIIGMTTEIARRFPDMQAYCDQRAWDSDETPWCGVSAGYCMAVSDIRPPFKDGSDTDCFGWAKSWADDSNFTVLKAPRLGCVVVLSRSGGGHVTFYESTSGSNFMCRGGNQGNAITLAPFPKSNVVALVWPNEGGPPPPIEPPSTALPMLRKGDSGPDVVYLQTLLPRWIDGDFGTTTESLVKEFQRSQGLETDGVVGEQTWAALLNEEPAPGPPPILPVTAKFMAEGKCSWFGGPDDKGVKADEGLAFISKVDQAPQLFLPSQPPGTTGLARRLDPDVFYIACRWDYKKTPRDMLLSQQALVRVPSTGKEFMAFPADWGPNEKTGRIADLSPGLMDALGIDTDDEVIVTFPYEASV